jgi:hypothetical protein
MTDRTPKPCLHKHANHQHGDYLAYVADKCRCFPCTEANRIRGAKQRRNKAYGRETLVDAGPVRAHVEQLRNLGMSIETIERLSGASHCAVQALVYATHKKVWPVTAERILSIPLRPPALKDQPGGRHMPSIGARRRIQALSAVGWSLTAIGRRAGIDKRTLIEMAWRDQCTVATHLTIVKLYDELWDSEPPSDTPSQRGSSSKARRHAQLNGWAPPMAWDDDTIDEPAAEPNYGVTYPERHAMHARGMSDRAIGREFGITAVAVRAWRTREGLPANYGPRGRLVS